MSRIVRGSSGNLTFREDLPPFVAQAAAGGRAGLLALPGLLLAILPACSPDKPSPTTKPAGGPPTLSVHFSPDGGCTDAIVRELNAARASICIQAYSFTSAPIAQAVAAARGRAVAVEAVLDRSNRTSQYSAATFLWNHGINVRIDARHGIAHNKIMIIDDQTVITGSFNFTKAAEESNAENLLIIRNDLALAEKYLANFRRHQEHSEPYQGPEKKPEQRTRSSPTRGGRPDAAH